MRHPYCSLLLPPHDPPSLWPILRRYRRTSRVGCTASFTFRAIHASKHVDPQDTPRPYFIRLNLTPCSQDCPARCQIVPKSCLCPQKIIPLQDLEGLAGAIRWQGARRIQNHQESIPRRIEHETRGETPSLYTSTSTIPSPSTASPPTVPESTGSPILYKMPLLCLLSLFRSFIPDPRVSLIYQVNWLDQFILFSIRSIDWIYPSCFPPRSYVRFRFRSRSPFLS